jgi:hypothetical protein
MSRKPYEHLGAEQYELGRDAINARAVPTVSRWLSLSPEQTQILGAKLQYLAPWLRGSRVADASADEVRNQVKRFADAADLLDQARAGLSLEARQLLRKTYTLADEATPADLLRSDMSAISRIQHLASIAVQSLKPSSPGPGRAPQAEIARELLLLVRTVLGQDFKLGTKRAAPVMVRVKNGQRVRVIRPDPERTVHFRAIQFLMAAVDPTLTRSQRAGAIDDAYAEWRANQRRQHVEE